MPNLLEGSARTSRSARLAAPPVGQTRAASGRKSPEPASSTTCCSFSCCYLSALPTLPLPALLLLIDLSTLPLLLCVCSPAVLACSTCTDITLKGERAVNTKGPQHHPYEAARDRHPSRQQSSVAATWQQTSEAMRTKENMQELNNAHNQPKNCKNGTTHQASAQYSTHSHTHILTLIHSQTRKYSHSHAHANHQTTTNTTSLT